MGQLNEKVKKLEEKLARLQEENSELRNEVNLKDVAIALMEKADDEILFGQSLHEKKEKQAYRQREERERARRVAQLESSQPGESALEKIGKRA